MGTIKTLENIVSDPSTSFWEESSPAGQIFQAARLPYGICLADRRSNTDEFPFQVKTSSDQPFPPFCPFPSMQRALPAPPSFPPPVHLLQHTPPLPPGRSPENHLPYRFPQNPPNVSAQHPPEQNPYNSPFLAGRAVAPIAPPCSNNSGSRIRALCHQSHQQQCSEQVQYAQQQQRQQLQQQQSEFSRGYNMFQQQQYRNSPQQQQQLRAQSSQMQAHNVHAQQPQKQPHPLNQYPQQYRQQHSTNVEHKADHFAHSLPSQRFFGGLNQAVPSRGYPLPPPTRSASPPSSSSSSAFSSPSSSPHFSSPPSSASPGSSTHSSPTPPSATSGAASSGGRTMAEAPAIATADKSPSGAATALPAEEVLPRGEVMGGYIFVCNNETMQEDLRRNLFGLPQRYRDSVRTIQPGLPLFLYNYTTHQLHGAFQSTSFGGTNLDPTAWEDKKVKGESRFPAQVRIRIRTTYHPLDEETFRPALHHYDGPKFRLQLTIPEALDLLDLFEANELEVQRSNFLSEFGGFLSLQELQAITSSPALPEWAPRKEFDYFSPIKPCKKRSSKGGTHANNLRSGSSSSSSPRASPTPPRAGGPFARQQQQQQQMQQHSGSMNGGYYMTASSLGPQASPAAPTTGGPFAGRQQPLQQHGGNFLNAPPSSAMRNSRISLVC